MDTSYNADIPDGGLPRPMMSMFAYRHRAKACNLFSEFFFLMFFVSVARSRNLFAQ